MGLINDVIKINSNKTKLVNLEKENADLKEALTNANLVKVATQKKLSELDGETFFSLQEKVDVLRKEAEELTSNISSLSTDYEEKINSLSELNRNIATLRYRYAETLKNFNVANRGKTFGDWSPMLHLEEEQINRQRWASNPYQTPLSLNGEALIAKFAEPNPPYSCQATLNNCECEDYASSKKPCKHMYRLAFELGIFSPINPIQTDLNLLRRMKSSDFINIAGKLPQSQVVLLSRIAYASRHYDNNGSIEKITDDLNSLFALKLVKESPDKDIIILGDIKNTLRAYKKTELLDIIPDTYEDKPDSKMLKDDIVKYIINHRELHSTNNLKTTVVCLDDSLRYVNVYEILKKWLQ